MTALAYTLDDPRPIAAEAPYTYFLPSEAQLAAIGPDDLVQLIFRPREAGRKWEAERMWVCVESAGDRLSGRLCNAPEDIPGLALEDDVSFQPGLVIDILWSEERSQPPPARPERREYWERCFVDGAVIDGTKPVQYLFRDQPETVEGDEYPDSGWRISAELSEAELEAGEVEYVALGLVLNHDDSWLHLIDAPIGARFTRESGSGEFVSDEGTTLDQ